MPEGKHYGKSLGLEPSLRAGSLRLWYNKGREKCDSISRERRR